MRVGSLFSGIGGIDLGLERAGMKIAWQVEIDEWCRRVLAKHWPDVPKFGDIRDCGAHNLSPVDVLAGGFPCQPVSFAGFGLAQDDDRWLWPEYARLIRELRPRFVLVENVAALLHRGFGDVLSDLAAAGYDATWDCLRASEFGAHHERERVYLLAYPNEGDGEARMGYQRDWARSLFEEGYRERDALWLQTPCARRRVDDGIPHRLYESRVGGLGNAVVPQIVEWIGRRIMAVEA